MIIWKPVCCCVLFQFCFVLAVSLAGLFEVVSDEQLLILNCVDLAVMITLLSESILKAVGFGAPYFGDVWNLLDGSIVRAQSVCKDV